MTRKILFLPIEIVVRELDANLLLASEALNRGYEVVLGGKGELKEFARYAGGGVYLYKHWESQFPYGFDDPRRETFFFAGLHQEGIVFLDEETFARRMMERGRTEKLDVNFVKGNVQRELLCSRYPELAKNTVVVGSPNFDLLRPEFRRLYEQDARRLQARWGPYVLVNTNFFLGNRPAGTDDELIEERNEASIKNVGRPLTEQEIRVIREGIAYKSRLCREYESMLRTLSKKFPDIHFILRPHPSEDHSTWRSRLADLPNVRVVFEGSVVTWLYGAQALIHTGCTTALEAWALHKPVIRYNPIDHKGPYESFLPNRVSREASTVSDVIAHLHDALGKEVVPDTDAVSVVKPYIDSITGPHAVTRILDHFDMNCSFVTLSESDRRRLHRYRTLRRVFAMAQYDVYSSISRLPFLSVLLGKSRAAQLYVRFQKFPGIRNAYIRRYLRTLRGNEYRSHVRRLGRAVWYIHAQ